MSEIHCLNGFLLFVTTVSVGIFAFRQHRTGRGISPPLQAAILLVQLQVLAQVYMGIIMLHNRRQRSLLHYGFGLLPILIFLTVYGFYPQLRDRRALAICLAFLTAALGVLLAILIAFSG